MLELSSTGTVQIIFNSVLSLAILMKRLNACAIHKNTKIKASAHLSKRNEKIIEQGA
jgi:hypothetical protein